MKYKTLAIMFLDTIATGKVDVFDDIIHPEYRPSLENMTQTTKNIVSEISDAKDQIGIEPLKARFNKFRRIWQHSSIEIIDIVEENEKIIAYYELEFTYAEAMLGINPKGKRIKVKAYHNFKIRDGKICHAHMLIDYYDIIRQIDSDPVLSDPLKAIQEYLDAIKSEGFSNLKM